MSIENLWDSVARDGGAAFSASRARLAMQAQGDPRVARGFVHGAHLCRILEHGLAIVAGRPATNSLDLKAQTVAQVLVGTDAIKARELRARTVGVQKIVEAAQNRSSPVDSEDKDFAIAFFENLMNRYMESADKALREIYR